MRVDSTLRTPITRLTIVVAALLAMGGFVQAQPTRWDSAMPTLEGLEATDCGEHCDYNSPCVCALDAEGMLLMQNESVIGTIVERLDPMTGNTIRLYVDSDSDGVTNTLLGDYVFDVDGEIVFVIQQEDEDHDGHFDHAETWVTTERGLERQRDFDFNGLPELIEVTLDGESDPSFEEQFDSLGRLTMVRHFTPAPGHIDAFELDDTGARLSRTRTTAYEEVLEVCVYETPCAPTFDGCVETCEGHGAE